MNPKTSSVKTTVTTNFSPPKDAKPPLHCLLILLGETNLYCWHSSSRSMAHNTLLESASSMNREERVLHCAVPFFLSYTVNTVDVAALFRSSFVPECAALFSGDTEVKNWNCNLKKIKISLNPNFWLHIFFNCVLVNFPSTDAGERTWLNYWIVLENATGHLPPRD